MLRRLLMGPEAGLLAGTLVGVAEALTALSLTASTSDYVALFYATVLYGAPGLVAGLAFGLVMALLGALWPMDNSTAYNLSFVGVVGLFGAAVGRFHLGQVVDPQVLQVARPAFGVALCVLAGLGLLLGPILLTRTPLKVLLRPKGTVAAWLSLAGLTAIFSFAPGGPGGEGELAPARYQPPGFEDKPNILLIVVDSLRADHLNSYGYGPPTSPALDSLAADSVLFEQAHAHSPWTRPAVASLLGGLLPSSHGVATSSAMLPDEVQTLPELLNAAGYVTGALINSPELTRNYNFQQGYDYFHYLKPEMPLWGTESVSQLAFYDALRQAIQRGRGGQRVVTDYYQPAGVTLARAQRFIEEQGQNRWFLLVHLMEPHAPYFERPLNGRAIGPEDPPGSPAAMSALYDDGIRTADAELAKLLDWLRATGRYDGLTIVLTADHGEELFDHGGWWHGSSLFEEVLRVPLLIKLPGQRLSGTRSDWTVRHIDLAPTLASLAGLPPDPSWEGLDLLDDEGEGALQALADADGAQPAEDPLPRPDTRTLNRTVLAELSLGGSPLSAVIQGGYKLIRANDDNPRGLPTESLYNLVDDPRETRNLAGQDIARQAGLAATLGRELEAARARAVNLPAPADPDPRGGQLRGLGYGP